MEKKTPKKVINVAISKEMHKEIWKIKKATNVPVRHIIESILSEYLKKKGGE